MIDEFVFGLLQPLDKRVEPTKKTGEVNIQIHVNNYMHKYK